MSSKPSFFVVSFLLITIGIAGSRAAPAEQSELDHSARIAQELGGETECRTPDGSRVDILTKDTAWEVERASKWQSAIGQSLFYGMATNRQPGIILLIAEPERERRYYLRCLAVCAAHGIRLEVRRIQ